MLGSCDVSSGHQSASPTLTLQSLKQTRGGPHIEPLLWCCDTSLQQPPQLLQVVGLSKWSLLWRSSGWLPPLPGIIKVNVDVAMRPLFAMAACVCRDHQGKILYAAAKKLCCVDSTMGEAEALWFGVSIANQFSWPDVIFEGGPLVVMTAVDRPLSDCPWQIESVVAMIKSCFAAHPSFKCSFSPWCANFAAHSLAQWAASSLREGCFLEFCGHSDRLPRIYEGSDPP
ncbi:hypothetical protein CJ030_MR4G018391 [Morella rubra]|uniref:RNase H type-1 domain-containing protein n=1 Tax=Morella rubra TaxID=262757 RepID=A0A6A1VRN3_9ROSI|nr:hypothetical protein CJ030_MR4G018391 [Morella rubra]